MEVTVDWLAFGASLKWPLEELQFLALLHWLHFTASEVAVWSLFGLYFIVQVFCPTLLSHCHCITTHLPTTSQRTSYKHRLLHKRAWGQLELGGFLTSIFFLSERRRPNCTNCIYICQTFDHSGSQTTSRCGLAAQIKFWLKYFLTFSLYPQKHITEEPCAEHVSSL